MKLKLAALVALALLSHPSRGTAQVTQLMGGGYTRTVRLLITEPPEAPVSLLHAEISVPPGHDLPLPAVLSLATVLGPGDEFAHDKSGSIKEGWTLRLFATLDPPRSLPRYLLKFPVVMTEPELVVTPFQVRQFYCMVEPGVRSQAVNVALVIESGAPGEGDRP